MRERLLRGAGGVVAEVVFVEGHQTATRIRWGSKAEARERWPTGIWRILIWQQ